jgi:hypothetical protein
MTRFARRTWVIGVALTGFLTLGRADAQTTVFRSARLFTLSFTNLDANGIGALVDVGSLAGGLDGIPDLLTGSQAQELGVFFGRADGTFSLGPSTSLGLIPTAMMVADITGDQVADVLFGDNGSTLSVWRGLGNGTFESAGPPLDAGMVPAGIAVADVNNDGRLDVLITGESNQFSGLARVFFGGSDGSLTPALETINTGRNSSAIVTGDFNRDGRVDFAVCNEVGNDVHVFRGDGMGGFSFLQMVPVGLAPIAIDVLDANSDGRLDLVVANNTSDNVALLDGRADGTFAAARFFPSGSPASTPNSMVIGDVNGDGLSDVIVSNNLSFDVAVLYGDGAGSLSAPRLFVLDAEPVGVLTGDLNRDGADDVVGLARGGGSFATAGVMLSRDGGGLNAVENLALDITPTQVVSGDINNDGLPDVLVSQGGTPSQPGSVRISYSTPFEGFLAPATLPSAGDAAGVAVGDFSGDGRPDVAILNRSTSNITLLRSLPRGGFASPTNITVGPGGNAVIAGDWNRDGREDLAVTLQGDASGGTLQVLIANASGGFGPPSSLPLGELPVALASGDFNNDGHADLVVANNASNNLSILLGNGNGSFRTPTTVGQSGGPRSVAVADFDRDGFDDLAVSLSLSPSVVVLFGDGTGRFPEVSRPLSVGGSDIPSSVSARDLNGDGNPDVAVAVEVASTVRVFLRSAAPNVRLFQTSDVIGVNRRPISLTTADFDGDGRYDAAAAASSPAPTTSVLTNIRAPGFLRGDGNGDGVISAADAAAVMRKLVRGTAIRVEDAGRGSYAAARGVDANGDAIVTLPDALAVSTLVFNPQFLGL